jgi:hypothetical protein
VGSSRKRARTQEVDDEGPISVRRKIIAAEIIELRVKYTRLGKQIAAATLELSELPAEGEESEED